MPEPSAAPRRPRWWTTSRVVVYDHSMEPTLLPGDRLVVDRAAFRDRRPRVGELVVLVDPEAPERWLVKRVAGLEGEGPQERRVVVASDAPERGRDSRQFGPVASSAIVGRVIRRYRPWDRAAEL